MKKRKATQLALFILMGILISCDQIMDLVNPEDEGLPSTPTGLQAVMASSGVVLTWNPVLGASEYIVYRATSLSGNYSRIGTSQMNTYKDTGVYSGTDYYTVAAKSKIGIGKQSSPVSPTTEPDPGPGPAAPESVIALTESSSSITVSWASVQGATGYKIYRSADGASYTQIGTTYGYTSYTDIGLSSNTTYYYQVSAVNDDGEGSRSSSTSATTFESSGTGSVPIAPEWVTASAESSSHITVSWALVQGATGYKVYRSTDGAFYTQISTTYGDTSYTDMGLTSNTTYYYQVSAVNDNGEGSLSSSAQDTTYPVATTPPSTPGGIRSEAGAAGGTTLTWDRVDAAVGYYIYRSNYDGGYTQIGTSISTSYTDTEANPSTYYYYKVSAYNEAGESEQSYSNYTLTYPSVPTGITAGATSSSSITVSWDWMPDASYYNIYRSETPEGPYIFYSTSWGTSWTDSWLYSGTTYYYKVRVYNGYGYEGALSSYAAALTYPSAPYSLQATVNASNHIVVSWAAVTGASSYKIYRAFDSYWGYTQVGSTEDTAYTDTTVDPNTDYYYKVKAVNESGEGEESDYIYARTHAGNRISVEIALGSEIGIESQTLEIPKGVPGTFSVSGSYTEYQWYLNGSLIDGAIDATYTLETGAMTPGIYELTVVVRSTTEQFSGTCRMKIIN